jgi:hypothetical protein
MAHFITAGMPTVEFSAAEVRVFSPACRCHKTPV